MKTKLLSPRGIFRIWNYHPNSSALYATFNTMKFLVVAILILYAVVYVASLKETSLSGYKQIELLQKDESISPEDKLKLDDLIKKSIGNDGVITRAEKSKIDNLYEDYRKHRLIEILIKEEGKYR